MTAAARPAAALLAAAARAGTAAARPAAALLAAAAAACGAEDGDGPACLDPPRGPALGRFGGAIDPSRGAFAYAARGFQGGGLGVIDLDGDGLPSFVAARRDGGAVLLANRGGLRFELVADSGLPPTPPRAIGAADLDNDGDADLVLGGEGAALVFANEGGLRFSLAARLPAGAVEHVLPVDLDGDGRLDLHLGGYDRASTEASRNRLYLGRGAPGALGFAPAPAPGDGLTWTATALDADADGDPDLYVANDALVADPGGGAPPAPSPWPRDLLLRNDGPGADGAPRMVEAAAELGLAAPRSSMGGLLADLDGDGGLDLLVPDFGAKKLFVRGSDGQWLDRAAALGLDAPARLGPRCPAGAPGESCLLLSWSAALADLELDGRDEVLLGSGETAPGDPPPVVLFARAPGGGEPAYRELAPGIPCTDARGLAATDLDGDGDADVVIAPRAGPLAVYENRGRPAPGRWLRVTLRGQRSGREGRGAVVTARLASGRTAVRAVGAGGVIHTAAPAEAVFGLGDDSVEALEVQWPSGARSVLAGDQAPRAGAVIVDEPAP